jgi:hypothetical protein
VGCNGFLSCLKQEKCSSLVQQNHEDTTYKPSLTFSLNKISQFLFLTLCRDGSAETRGIWHVLRKELAQGIGCCLGYTGGHNIMVATIMSCILCAGLDFLSSHWSWSKVKAKTFVSF